MKLPTSQQMPASVESLDIGLVAGARVRSWSIEIDQTVSGDERWFAQIEGPAAYLYFEIASVAAIEQPARLFAERVAGKDSTRASQAMSIELGSFAGRPVSLLFDDEFADRCFFHIADDGVSTIRFSVAGTDFVDLAAAIQQVAGELNRDGWLGEG